jgi:hypothetical protein
MVIEIRAHHLNCIPRFYRGGYDEVFAQNMKDVCSRIRENPDCEIRVVVAEPDVLCMKCPHRAGQVCVQSTKIGKWVVEQDNKIFDYLDLKKDAIYKAKDIFNLAISKINPDTIDDVCKNCIFLKNCKKVGVNKSFIKDLNKKQ